MIVFDEARQFLIAYDHYKEYGFGRWAVRNKDGGMFLGWCGLKYTKKSNEYDIGFRFQRAAWNMGYATEAAKSCIGYGFEKLGISEIVGRAMKENIASIRVLEKSGMAFQQNFDFEGNPGVLYKINAAS